MGKNQAYKAQQRAKMASRSSTDGPEGEGTNDGFVDGTFHSPEWHAARLASLQTSATLTWEEFKAKQKEEARKQNELADDEEKRMKEYRKQLDAERANKLSRGRNHKDKAPKEAEKEKSSKKGKESEKRREKEDKKRKVSKKRDTERRHKRRKESSASDSEGSDSGSDRKREKSRRRKKEHKKKRQQSASSTPASGGAENGKEGPVPLSSFFTGEPSG